MCVWTVHWLGKQSPEFKEGNRARWRGRASNPVGDGIRSRAGSTPAAFRHFHQKRPKFSGYSITT